MNKINTYLGGAVLAAAVTAGCADDRKLYESSQTTDTCTGGQAGAGAEGGNAGSGGEAGQGGSETCRDDETKCGNECVDLYTDNENCGECGVICAGVNEECFNAVCECKTGTYKCDGSDECMELTTDAHCGSCTTACEPDETCQCASDLPPESCYHCM